MQLPPCALLATRFAAQVLTAQLLFHKPEDPKAFLIELLTKMQTQGAKPMLDEADVDTMFTMFDVTQKGRLTQQQVHQAVRTMLGAEHPIVQQAAQDGSRKQEMLDKEQFVAYVMGALQRGCPAT